MPRYKEGDVPTLGHQSTTKHETEEQKASLLIKVPDSLKNEFKATCSLEGKSMTDVVQEFMIDYVELKSTPK